MRKAHGRPALAPQVLPQALSDKVLYALLVRQSEARLSATSRALPEELRREGLALTERYLAIRRSHNDRPERV